MNLVKILIPSWRFFDRPSDLAFLYVRTQTKDGIWSAWRPCLNPPLTKITNLFLNPMGNLYLACQSLVNRFAEEVSNHQTHTSLDYIKRLVTETVDTQDLHAYQFRIEVTPVNGAEPFELFVSEEFICER